MTTLLTIVEGALHAAGRPLSVDALLALFDEGERPGLPELRAALATLAAQCQGRGIELKEVASGFRYQARAELAPWLVKLWEERPPRYSRATLETLALIAYRQPVTRAEIEEVRGVTVSSSIIKTLLEREWIRVVGHRDVPGRPALFATTRGFLDYFNLKSLDELPSLLALQDLDRAHAEQTLPLPAPSPDDAARAPYSPSLEAVPAEKDTIVADDEDTAITA